MSDRRAPGELPLWRARDTRRWAACRPAVWSRPWWGALALAMAVGAVLVLAPGALAAPHCWLAAAQVYWLFRLPQLTLVSAPLSVALLVWLAEPMAALPVCAALAVCWAGARHRLAVRRRRRLLAANAAGDVRLRLPAPVPALRRRGLVPAAVGLPLCAVAAVPFLLPVALAGFTLLVTGLRAMRRAAALRRDELPVLRVLSREDEDTRVWVYAADDTAGRVPVFSCPVRPGSAIPDDDHAPGDSRLRDTLLFGAPFEGAELVLLSADVEHGPLIDRVAGPVRPVAG
ncbi:hypothetical protein ACIP9H_30290 [Streptomyces sp. NPDC088732]|uniref:hypothetical protein n=1 Tax=Streptomyces sp. NPDC088732 TaxID=3365879 RepID=UPI0037FB54F1